MMSEHTDQNPKSSDDPMSEEIQASDDEMQKELGEFWEKLGPEDRDGYADNVIKSGE